MPQESRIEVINRFGWHKDFVLEKPIIQIGKDARNDIVLDDGHASSVSPRHAQLLPSAANKQGLRLVNLSDQEIGIYSQVTEPSMVEGAPTAVVTPRSSAELGNGDLVKIGEFSLVIHGGEQRSEIVKLEVETVGTELTLDQPLVGKLKIHHVGNKAAVQFRIEVEGIAPNFVEIGPGPVLFPNAEKEVSFRLMHPRRANPPAGNHTISFHVTAPDAYPEEQASASVEVHVAPFFQHRLRVVVMDSPDFRLT